MQPQHLAHVGRLLHLSMVLQCRAIRLDPPGSGTLRTPRSRSVATARERGAVSHGEGDLTPRDRHRKAGEEHAGRDSLRPWKSAPP